MGVVIQGPWKSPREIKPVSVRHIIDHELEVIEKLAESVRPAAHPGVYSIHPRER